MQRSNLLFVDIDLPGILDAILCDISWLGTSCCLVLYYPEGKRGLSDQVHFFLSFPRPTIGRVGKAITVSQGNCP